MSKTKQNTKTNVGKSSSFLFGLIVNLFKPSLYVDSVSSINLDSLWEQGFRTIICDLDNTLVPLYAKTVTKSSKQFVDKAKKMGFTFILASNNTTKRVSYFANKFGVEKFIPGLKKPFTRKLKKYMKENFINNDETVMIGDLFVFDTVVANFLKVDSILVKPLVDGEKWFNSFLNWMEKKIYQKLSKENILNSNEISNSSIYSKGFDLL